jgi:MFS family permease
MTHVTDEEETAGALPRALWCNGDFLLLWSGQAVSTLGSTISTLALPLLVLTLTHSAAQAGFIAAAQAIPYIILGLPAGALIDRWDRKAVMIRCDVARALALGSVPLTATWGRLTTAQLYVVALVTGTALVFFNIAQTAALTRVVSGEQLPRATALDRTADSVAALIGPGVGGFLISLARSTLAGAALAFLVDGISYLASACSLLLIRLPFQAQRAPVVERALRAEIAEGLDFLWTHRRIRALAMVSMTATLFFSPLSLAVIVLAQQRLHADARTIGAIFSIGSIGAVLGAVLAPSLKAHFRVGTIVIGVIVVQALAIGLLAVATSPLLLIAGWAVISLADPIYSVTVLSYRLTLIPDALQGRVTGVFRLLNNGGRPLGLAVGGLLLAALGPRPVLWIMAAGGMLIAVVVSRTELRHA